MGENDVAKSGRGEHEEEREIEFFGFGFAPLAKALVKGLLLGGEGVSGFSSGVAGSGVGFRRGGVGSVVGPILRCTGKMWGSLRFAPLRSR